MLFNQQCKSKISLHRVENTHTPNNIRIWKGGKKKFNSFSTTFHQLLPKIAHIVKYTANKRSGTKFILISKQLTSSSTMAELRSDTVIQMNES